MIQTEDCFNTAHRKPKRLIEARYRFIENPPKIIITKLKKADKCKKNRFIAIAALFLPQLYESPQGVHNSKFRGDFLPD